MNRWRPETDQPARWLATGLLAAEDGFRRVPNYRDLGMLAKHWEDKRDEENLRAVRDKLPDWLVEALPLEETDEKKQTSADTEIDTADKVTVGSSS